MEQVEFSIVDFAFSPLHDSISWVLQAINLWSLYAAVAVFPYLCVLVTSSIFH